MIVAIGMVVAMIMPVAVVIRHLYECVMARERNWKEERVWVMLSVNLPEFYTHWWKKRHGMNFDLTLANQGKVGQSLNSTIL